MNNSKFKIGDKVIFIESRLSGRFSSKPIADSLRGKILTIKEIIQSDFGINFLKFVDIDHSERGGINPRLFDKANSVLIDRKSKISSLND